MAKDGGDDLALVRGDLSSTRHLRVLRARLARALRAPVRVALRHWFGDTLAGLDEDDLTSEIFFRLIEHDGRVLREWDPARASLDHYVSLFARSRIKELERKELNRRRLVPVPVSLEGVGDVGPVSEAPDELVAARELARLIRACVSATLTTDRAREMLGLLFDRGLDTDEIEALGHDRQAVFRWRSTILKAARACFERLQKGDEPPREPAASARREE